jgi:hypothetical protein
MRGVMFTVCARAYSMGVAELKVGTQGSVRINPAQTDFGGMTASGWICFNLSVIQLIAEAGPRTVPRSDPG